MKQLTMSCAPTWICRPRSRVGHIPVSEHREGHALIFADNYLHTDYDFARCCYELLGSKTFAQNRDYVRRQFVYGILQVRLSATITIPVLTHHPGR